VGNRNASHIVCEVVILKEVEEEDLGSL